MCAQISKGSPRGSGLGQWGQGRWVCGKLAGWVEARLLSKHLWLVAGSLLFVPAQEETPKAEAAEPEPSAPDADDDGRRHGFLILSREDSTMVRSWGLAAWGRGLSGQGPSPARAHRSCRRARRSWSWTPVALPRRAPQSLPATSGTIATSCRCRRWASACWKEVGWPVGWAGGRPGRPLRMARADRPVPAVSQLHFIPVDLGSPIVQCAVADPYVVIMSAEGQITMFVLKSDSYGGRHHRLALHKPPLHHVGPPPPPGPSVPTPPQPTPAEPPLPPQQSKVIALCVYRDSSGMFTTESRLGGARDELGGRSGSEAEGPGSETRCMGGRGTGALELGSLQGGWW